MHKNDTEEEKMDNEDQEENSLIEFYEKKMATYSSLAKYGIAILSAIIVIFPSSYTFIHPPYKYDGLLTTAFIFGVIAFLIECRVILLVDYREDSSPFSAMQNSAWGAMLTLATLCLLFSYVGINVSSDRSTPPRIVDLKYQPVQIKTGMLVELSGKATDQDLDDLTWKWNVLPTKPRGSSVKITPKKEELDSNLRTAHWIAQNPGEYTVFAMVTDDDGLFSESKITILVRK